MAGNGSDFIRKRSRGYLPHWERNDGTYFATFRLGDSLPQPVLEEMARQKQVLAAARQAGRKLHSIESVTEKRLSSRKIEAYLDSGAGACWFKRSECAAVVAEALRFWDGKRYQLEAWCVMPNHVHVLFWLFDGGSLARILGSWKKFSSRRINAMVDRRGMLWQDESYDHLIRNEEEFARAVRYILDNPRKAGLSDWPWVPIGPARTSRHQAKAEYGEDPRPERLAAFASWARCLGIGMWRSRTRCLWRPWIYAKSQ